MSAAQASPVPFQACVPIPLQVVIDDVGWWSGVDGHENGEPYRTGIGRDHVPADYAALAELGRSLGMRPQAALVLAEWDTRNWLRDAPHAQWMGAAWDNSRWVGPWLEEAADILRTNTDHIELALHGIGHEYWDGAGMTRAEWHDMDGRMRPRAEIHLRIALFERLLDLHGLGPFPEAFVPAAFVHRFGVGREGLAGILREKGVYMISTPFHGMHRAREPEHELFGFDAGVITVDRGHDPFRWFEIAPQPGEALTGPICGMHWPHILHPDPARNREVVERWVAHLAPYDQRFDTMLAPDSRAFCSQLVHHAWARIESGPDGIGIDLQALGACPAHLLENVFAVNVAAPPGTKFAGESASLDVTVQAQHAGMALHRITVRPGEDYRCGHIGIRAGKEV